MLEELKEQVYQANLNLVRLGLVLFTWGNVSAVDRERGVIVIKPSGIEYESMGARDMVVVDFDGKTVEGGWNPSSDLPTHLELYRAFPRIEGVTHTHSLYATSFAQAGRSIPAYGTTHADYFYGEIPCTRPLTQREVASAYERSTGRVVAEAFASRDPMATPGCLVHGHAPFTWGESCDQAVYHAAVLEYCARMARMTEQLNPGARPIDAALLDRHYLRKHGPESYYGQKAGHAEEKSAKAD